MSRADVSFPSGDVECRAWHCSPDAGDTMRPCIVMGHGFGATREFGLAPYAERFRAAGFHVLVFDYRHFGESGGEPRQLLSIRRQLKDWRAAIAHARGIDGVDASRVALWGSSFAGGHVVWSAAHDPRVAAIVAQGPMMDGRAALVRVIRHAGWRASLRMVGHGLLDMGAGVLRRAPHTLPIVGPPGSMAMLTTPDSEGGVQAIAPDDFDNRVCARVGLTTGFYRPVKVAHRIRCPALIQICEQDSLVSNEAAEEVGKRIGSQARVVKYPIGHFDMYVGEPFEQFVTEQLDFFRRHLG